MEQSQPLKDKVVLVTGGSVGIGATVAEKCAEAGARVVIASRTEKELKAELGKLKKIGPREHDCRVLDVGDHAAVEACAAWARGKFGRLDGLVNCAGVYGPIGPLNEVDIAEFARAIQINFLGTVFTCHYFAPLLAGHGGKIVNYSGGGAAGPFANYSAYATGKTAIVRLTENLAEEYKPLGIEVNVVAPGFVVTRLHEQTLQAGGSKAGTSFLEKTKQEIQKGGVPPEKAARLTVYLLSKESDGINGRFLSAPWDPWEAEDYRKRLRENKNLATLRRIDVNNFAEAKK